MLVPILGVWVFVSAAFNWWPFSGGALAFPGEHWLPHDISVHGVVIDGLYYFILAVTGAVFIATTVAMFWFLLRYDGRQNATPVKFIHGSHTLEVIWSVLPAVTLLFIAIFQMNAWSDVKIQRPLQSVGPDGEQGTLDDVFLPPLLEVTGRQFEWKIRYPGEDQEFDTPDDIHLVNDLHIPVDEEIVIAIKSDDVLHSFFLPNVRLKQDVVPGMKQYIWFEATETGTFDIVCAELCGWGHYKMKGRLTVESREDFERWLGQKYKAQETNQLSLELAER
ncbi:MAG: cytochrome c oxidase subunit II [Planctomycetaceae bacterium]|jgi:cytochrome c oxidase subunit 2|nr:cytochrome c oxidase subunit II [Planctomycetaceae bacterium]